MAVSIGLREVRRVSGKIYLHFDDGTGLEFDSLAQIRAFAQTVEEDANLLRRMLALYWFKRDATGATPATIEGKTVTLDMGGATLLAVG